MTTGWLYHYTALLYSYAYYHERSDDDRSWWSMYTAWLVGVCMFAFCVCVSSRRTCHYDTDRLFFWEGKCINATLMTFPERHRLEPVAMSSSCTCNPSFGHQTPYRLPCQGSAPGRWLHGHWGQTFLPWGQTQSHRVFPES